MNRVKAGDAWARVFTKRYGSRLDGNEARRIEILSRSLAVTLFSSPSLPLPLPLSYLVCVFLALSLSLSLSLARPTSLYVFL